MSGVRRLLISVVLLALPLFVVIVLLTHWCPAAGIGFSQEVRDFHRLKNRMTIPQPSDFDSQATLANLLQPGADGSRWSTARAARLEGYVVAVNHAGVELANCYMPCRRDTHINIAQRSDAPAREQVVLEVTPRLEDQARREGHDWSAETLKKQLIGHWCAFEGWLFFDSNHALESENTAPSNANNWRATAWEIHPVTSIQVIR